MAVDTSGKADRGTKTGMVTAPDTDKGRHVYGPRPLAALVPGIARPALRKRSPAAAQLIADWSAIVGPALAARTVPKKLVGAPVDHRLHRAGGDGVAVPRAATHRPDQSSYWRHSGRAACLRAGDRRRTSTPSLRQKPTVETNKRAEYAVRLLPDGELRAALAALGRAVMTERPLSATPSTAIHRRSRRITRYRGSHAVLPPIPTIRCYCRHRRGGLCATPPPGPRTRR